MFQNGIDDVQQPYPNNMVAATLLPRQPTSNTITPTHRSPPKIATDCILLTESSSLIQPFSPRPWSLPSILQTCHIRRKHHCISTLHKTITIQQFLAFPDTAHIYPSIRRAQRTPVTVCTRAMYPNHITKFHKYEEIHSPNTSQNPHIST